MRREASAAEAATAGAATAEAGAATAAEAGAATATTAAALLAALLLFVALAIFGQRYHWVEEAGTAERDGYVAQAEELLRGTLPRDPYRPLLYPILAAGLGGLIGDPFAAARLVSNLAAAALAWLAYAHGRRLAGPVAGAWAMALCAANPNLWRIGQHTSTDMLFAALAAGALLAGLAYLDSPRWPAALAAGLLLGLAAFTRSNAVFLAPALLAAWWLGSRSRPSPGAAPGGAASRPGSASGAAGRRPAPTSSAAVPPSADGVRRVDGRLRLGHLAIAAAAWAAALFPHWLLRYRTFGDPFHDENWKNLAFKLYGFPDWSYLSRVPYRGTLELLAANPAAVLRGGAAEIWRFATAGAPQLLGTWAHVALFVLGVVWVLGRVLPSRVGASLAQGSLGPAAAHRLRSAAWLFFACGFFVVATAFAFFTWGRFLLLLLPPACALTFAPWAELEDAAPASGRAVLSGGRFLAPARRLALARPVLTGVALAAVAGLAVKTFAFRVPAFVAGHPYVEVATLRALDRALPPGAALAGSSPFLGRYLGGRSYLALPDAFGAQAVRPELYFAELRRLLSGSRVTYLVIGALDRRDRPRSLLAGTAESPGPVRSPVPWLAPAGAGRGVVVWKVAATLSGWPASRRF